MTKLIIRKIKPADNPQVASVIRTVMTEFGAVGSGFSIEDPEVDAMFQAYQSDKSAFYVVSLTSASVKARRSVTVAESVHAAASPVEGEVNSPGISPGNGSVLTRNVTGCGGIAPLRGGDADTCELKKMYFLPEARGQGAGRVLAELLINDARQLGFRQIYIETLARMDAANRLYQRLGFRRLARGLGNTGHSGCDMFYSMQLDELETIKIG